jgi:hypothetical protein
LAGDKHLAESHCVGFAGRERLFGQVLREALVGDIDTTKGLLALGPEPIIAQRLACQAVARQCERTPRVLAIAACKLRLARLRRHW